jgi:hypothetical protein
MRSKGDELGDRIGRAVAHFSFRSSIVSSRIPRARRRTPLMVVFSDSTTPKQTVNEFGLTVLNLTDPAIAGVTSVLADAAWWHADSFDRAHQGVNVRLSKHVRLAADGVFVDDRKVIELDQVVEQVARIKVTEISLVHRAIKRGMAWGAAMGVVAGAAIIAAQCGTNWSERSG